MWKNKKNWGPEHTDLYCTKTPKVQCKHWYAKPAMLQLAVVISVINHIRLIGCRRDIAAIGRSACVDLSL